VRIRFQNQSQALGKLPVGFESLSDKEILELASRVELEAASDFVDAFPNRTPARVTTTAMVRERVPLSTRSATLKIRCLALRSKRNFGDFHRTYWFQPHRMRW
jgi:hypothetical protein